MEGSWARDRLGGVAPGVAPSVWASEVMAQLVGCASSPESEGRGGMAESREKLPSLTSSVLPLPHHWVLEWRRCCLHCFWMADSYCCCETCCHGFRSLWSRLLQERYVCDWSECCWHSPSRHPPSPHHHVSARCEHLVRWCAAFLQSPRAVREASDWRTVARGGGGKLSFSGSCLC